MYFILLLFILFKNTIQADQLYFNFENSLIKSYDEIRKDDLPIGFKLVDENEPNGPITVSKENDDGTKRNLLNIIRSENENNLSFKYENFKNMNNTIPKKSEFFCEIKSSLRPEGIKGYDISCPKHYTITIRNAFYGRYANDKKRCKVGNRRVYKKRRLNIKQCGYTPIEYVKELCEGKEYCTIIPSKNFFKDYCGKNISKYLHIDYNCIKDKVNKKKKKEIIKYLFIFSNY